MSHARESVPSSAPTYAEFATADDCVEGATRTEMAPSVASLSSLEERRSMATQIFNFEARRDRQGRLKVYRLPKGDGGGRFEVAGINDRYHREVCLRLVALIEANAHAEAEALAIEYIAGYTDVVDRWCSVAAIEFFLRDCVFNRGPGGAAWIVQRTCGVATDMVVGERTRAAIRSRERDPRLFLDRLVSAREDYEREKAGRDESSDFWDGLINRWIKAKGFALTLLPQDDETGLELSAERSFQPIAEAAYQTSRGTLNLSQDGTVAIGSNGLEIEYQGSDTCPYGQSATSRKKPFRAVVVHHTDPRFDVDWYVRYQIEGDRQRGGHFGYHFYIGYDGRIIQGAPLTKRTNHIKPVGQPERRAFGKSADNTNAIGITCSGAGKPSFKPTQMQLASLYPLTRALCQVYGIKFSEIYGHGELQTDRHETEGRSAAQLMRAWPSGGGSIWLEGAVDDDMDDGPIGDLAGLERNVQTYEIESDYAGIEEDADDQSADSCSQGDGIAGEVAFLEAPTTIVRYVNQSAIRNKKCTATIEAKLALAIEAVYGPGCTVNIYSGGQDRKGKGTRRTGSIRHDDYGNGGRAADIHVFDPSRRQIQGLELARLGQYWLAKRFGGVGHEMAGGGIHLDEWTTPPKGAGMYWTYAYSQSKPWGAEAKRMLERGLKGEIP